MLLHDQLKQELSEKINSIAQAQKPLSKELALLFGELQELILRAQTGIALVTHIQRRLSKIPYRFLGFLPVVNDVRRQLEKVLKRSDYQTLKLLIEENMYIREENHELRKEIEAVRNLSLNPKYEQHIIDLEKNLGDKVSENNLLKLENEALCQVVKNQEIENDELTRKIAGLTKLYDGVVQQNAALQDELELLRNASKSNSEDPKLGLTQRVRSLLFA